mgnify:CR=1 FL=1
MTAADDTDGTLRQLPADVLAPCAAQDFGASFGRVAEKLNGEGNHQFRDRAFVGAAGPAQFDPGIGHGVQVYRVETDAIF